VFRHLFEDGIHIAAPPAAVFSFFERMAENYLAWHPDHLKFEWRGPAGLEVGNVFYFEERIAGKVLRKQTRFTRVVPGRRIEFTMTSWLMRLFLPKLSFEFAPENGGCRFTARIHLRGVGPIGRALNRREFDAVRRHMAEEGENLKALIETGAA
jgi:uncharacterized protein YndB with AHSA1/START domain